MVKLTLFSLPNFNLVWLSGLEMDILVPHNASQVNVFSLTIMKYS